MEIKAIIVKERGCSKSLVMFFFLPLADFQLQCIFATMCLGYHEHEQF